MDGPTDQWTDKASYRDAWTHLKTSKYNVAKDKSQANYESKIWR